MKTISSRYLTPVFVAILAIIFAASVSQGQNAGSIQALSDSDMARLFGSICGPCLNKGCPNGDGGACFIVNQNCQGLCINFCPQTGLYRYCKDTASYDCGICINTCAPDGNRQEYEGDCSNAVCDCDHQDSGQECT